MIRIAILALSAVGLFALFAFVDTPDERRCQMPEVVGALGDRMCR